MARSGWSHAANLVPAFLSSPIYARIHAAIDTQVAHLALVAVYLACFRDYSPYLGAGEVATIAVIAANRMQARSIFRYVLGLLEAVPALKVMIKDDTADQIMLNNRVVIEIHTASFRVTRGYTLAAALR